jgi:CRISPR type III-A-associated protein Csm2
MANGNQNWQAELRRGWWVEGKTGVDGQRVMRAELFDPLAKQIADAFGTGLSTSQLRNFYDELKGLDDRVRAYSDEAEREQAFWAVLPLVKKVKALANYAAQKSGSKVPGSFREFLDIGIDQVCDNHHELHAFVLLFEAVAGFARTKS